MRRLKDFYHDLRAIEESGRKRYSAKVNTHEFRNVRSLWVLAVGAVAGLKQYSSEAKELTQSRETAAVVLREFSALVEADCLMDMILNCYDAIMDGSSILELCQHADQVKHRTLSMTISM